MARLWQDLLNGLRGKRAAKGPERPAPARRSRQDTPRGTVALNVGVDFGTSFTKICFRDSGADQSGIVRLGKDGAAIIPSIVCVAANGRLYRKGRTPPAARLTEIPFLKMRLAGMPIENDDPAIARLNLGSDAAGRALSAWFLATVLSESRTWLETAEEQRFRNRDIIWTANVGVPVEHCDSPVLAVFREVLAVACSGKTAFRRPSPHAWQLTMTIVRRPIRRKVIFTSCPRSPRRCSPSSCRAAPSRAFTCILIWSIRLAMVLRSRPNSTDRALMLQSVLVIAIVIAFLVFGGGTLFLALKLLSGRAPAHHS